MDNHQSANGHGADRRPSPSPSSPPDAQTAAQQPATAAASAVPAAAASSPSSSSASPSTLSSAMVVNLPTFSSPASLPAPLTAVSSLLSPVYPPPSSPLLRSPVLPASLSAVRALISQLFLLRCDVLDVFERWAQLPALDVSRLQQPTASPLLLKLVQKQQQIEYSWHHMQQLQRQAGMERMDRARRAGMRKQKTIMGYEGLMPAGSEAQQQQEAAAGGSNAMVLQRMRAVHAAVRHSRRELHRSLQGLFPSLYQSLRTHPAVAPTSSLQLVLDTALAMVDSMHPSAAAGGTWRGLQLQLETDDDDDIVGLIASLPMLLRVRIQLRRAAAPLSAAPHVPAAPLSLSSPASAFALLPQLSVSGWTEELLSPHSVSSLRVMSLVQAQLTAAALQPQAATVDAALVFLLCHISRYDTLFSSPCAACGRLLQLADDSLLFVPPVVRTRRDGHSLHIACAEGWRTAVPAQQPSSGSGTAAAAPASASASAPAAISLASGPADVAAAQATAAAGLRPAEQAA